MKDTLIVTDHKSTKEIVLAVTNSINNNELEIISITHNKDSNSDKESITIVYREKYK